MYSPKIPETLIPRLWAIARAQKRPMTQVAADAIRRYLDGHEQPEVGYALTEQGRECLRRAKAAV